MNPGDTYEKNGAVVQVERADFDAGVIHYQTWPSVIASQKTFDDSFRVFNMPIDKFMAQIAGLALVKPVRKLKLWVGDH